jgi:hypothetical protein
MKKKTAPQSGHCRDGFHGSRTSMVSLIGSAAW